MKRIGRFLSDVPDYLLIAALVFLAAVKRLNSLVAGSLVVLLLITLAVITPVWSTAHFERAVLENVDRRAVGMTESGLTDFARETMDYLWGRTQDWQPDTPFVIPQSFHEHMADVREVLKAIPWLLLAALPMGTAAVWMEKKWFWTGCAGTAALLAAVLLWAAFDFGSLWMILHRLFIPGGIFPAGEPVMQLFPLSLFFSYVKPVVFSLAGYLLALAGIVMITYQRGRR